MANDLLSALRTYLTKISSGEKSPQEVAAALNLWARESGEAIKERIEVEVKKNVSKMGFAKESELKRLESELTELRRLLKEKGLISQSAKQTKNSGAKNAPAKPSAKSRAPKKAAKKPQAARAKSARGKK